MGSKSHAPQIIIPKQVKLSACLVRPVTNAVITFLLVAPPERTQICSNQYVEIVKLDFIVLLMELKWKTKSKSFVLLATTVMLEVLRLRNVQREHMDQTWGLLLLATACHAPMDIFAQPLRPAIHQKSNCVHWDITARGR